MKTKIFGKQMSLFDKEHPDLFTGQEKDGKKLLPSEKNPLVRRWQTDANEKNITDKKNMLDNNVKNDYISGEKKNKQGETTMEATHSPIKITKGEMEFEVNPLDVVQFNPLKEPDLFFEINFKNKNKKDKFLFSQVKFFKKQNSYGINLGRYDDVTQEINEMLKLPKNRELTILIDNPTYQKMESIYDEELDKYNKLREKEKAEAVRTLREKFNNAKQIKIRYFLPYSGHNVAIGLVGEKLSDDEKDYLNNSEEFRELNQYIYHNVTADNGFQLVENSDYAREYIADKDWVLKQAKEFAKKRAEAEKERQKQQEEKDTKKYQEARQSWLEQIEKGQNQIKELEEKLKSIPEKVIVKDNSIKVLDSPLQTGGYFIGVYNKTYPIKDKLKSLGLKYNGSPFYSWSKQVETEEEKDKLINEINNIIPRVEVENKEYRKIKDEIETIQRHIDKFSQYLKLTKEEFNAMHKELRDNYRYFMDGLNAQGEDSPIGDRYHRAQQEIYDRYLNKK